MEKVKIFVPGRVGLIGEISDLVSPYLSKNKELVEGHAISFPIKEGIYSNCKKSEKIVYRNREKYFQCEISENKIQEEAESNGFFSYMCGTILYLIRNYKVSGIEIEIEKMDLPIGKGLSSSAAICLTVAKAYNELYGLNLSDEEIKNIAYNGEHLAQSQCGKLDQESIMNKTISHIIFKEKEIKSEELFIKKDIYILVIDLNQEKNTKAIIKAFNNALPFAKNENDKIIHDIIGEKNKKLVQKAIDSIKTGDIVKLGETLAEAQKLMDRAQVICSELRAPVLHQLLEDENVKKHIYGGKSSGSGGDGTAVLICKNEENLNQLKKYIEEKYKMNTIKTKVEKTKKKNNNNRSRSGRFDNSILYFKK